MTHPSEEQARVDTADRAAHPVSACQPVPPRTPYEEAVVAIWRDVLGAPDIGVFDDFFEVGGHSLLVTRVVARIRKVLGVRIQVKEFFENPTVAALAATVAECSSAEAGAVTRRSPDAEPVLSFDQERLWLEHQLLPGAAYNVHVRRRLVGPLDVDTLAASIRVILDRHEALRTRFPVVDGRPVPVVDDIGDWRLDVVDLAGVDDSANAASRLMDEDAAAVFDLSEGPLFRCRLVRLTDAEHLLTVTMHHIVSDDWSIGVFVRELVALYEAGGDPGRAGLPTLPVQYRDFAVWQRQHRTGEDLWRAIDYWRRHLDGAPPVLTMPSAPRNRGARGDRTHSILTGQETAALHALCRAHGVTPFMVILAALATVLRRWSGQPDLVIGVPVAGRSEHGTEELIGCFVNTLPVRVELSDAPTFTELLERVRQVAVDGYANVDAPLDVLVKELRVPRDPRRSPLFQVLLNVLGSPPSEQVGGLTVEPLDQPGLPAKYDLVFNAQETGSALRLRLDYDADRYPADLMRALLGHLHTLLGAVTDDPTKGVLDYPLEQAAEVAGAEATPPPYRPATAHLAVAHHARCPDRVAVIDEDGRWGYGWLHEVADRVADALGRHGISCTDRVGLIWHPTAACAAAILGCQRAGVSFLLLDDADPTLAKYLGVASILDVDPSPAAEGSIDLGSLFRDRPAPPRRGPQPEGTDTPTFPGDWAVDRFDLGHHDRFAVSSDQSTHLLAALSAAVHAGGTLVLPGPAISTDVSALTSWLQANAVTVVHATPPTLRAIAGCVPRPHLSTLRYAFVENNGDLFAHDITSMRQLSPACRVVGVYGTDHTGRPLTTYPVPDDWHGDTAPPRVPLGAELPDGPTVLGTSTGLPPVTGEVAEICAGERRTGDLARRWPDGTLEYAGRDGGGSSTGYMDEMVMALRDLPGVRDVVLTEHAGSNGDTAVVAYLTGPDPGSDTGELRRHLIGWLPDFLVPEHLVVLAELSLTSHGDYDLAALPVPRADAGPHDAYVPPRTPMEHELAEMLQELLDLDRVGIRDSFFELGGFSLLATRLVARMLDTFNVELSLRDVFQSPTIEGLAQVIVRAQGELLGTDGLETLLTELEGA